MKTIKRTTADDGTELELKERSDGSYIVTERGESGRTGEVARSKAEGRRQLQETSRLYGSAANAGRSDTMGGSMDMGGGFGGNVFGGGDSGDSMDMGGGFDGGLFGGGGGGDMDRDRDVDSGGGFGGSLFGGGGGGGDSRRDPSTGKFAPKRSRRTGFEMERNDDGTFAGRKDDSDDNGGGLFSFLK